MYTKRIIIVKLNVIIDLLENILKLGQSLKGEKDYGKIGDRMNRPFPSYSLPHFQNKSSCKTIQMKTILISLKMDMHAKLIFI